MQAIIHAVNSIADWAFVWVLAFVLTCLFALALFELLSLIYDGFSVIGYVISVLERRYGNK